MSDRSWLGVARRYGFAVGVVTITIALKAILLGADHPFVLLPGAVALAAWFGGRGPGLVAAAIVMASVLYLVLGPPGSPESVDYIAAGALLLESLLVAFITAGLRSALARARASSAESAVAHREAAFALAVRDELLLLWTTQLRGPMAELETAARAALTDLERAGYVGEATEQLRALVANAERVGRTTAGWDRRGRSPDEQTDLRK